MKTGSTLLLLALFSVPLQAQSSNPDPVEKKLDQIQKELKALRENQARLRHDIQAIERYLLAKQRKNLPARARFRGKTVNIDDDPVRGNGQARITIVEFSDYQCPFCARHFRQTAARLDREYIQSGRVRYVFHNFPLERLHKRAFRAAQAAECAGQQGHYWEMHDLLFANNKHLGEEDLHRLAQQLKLNMPTFGQCLDRAAVAAGIRRDIAAARKLGVSSTPTFLIGESAPGSSQVKIVDAIAGAAPFAAFRKILDPLLKKTR